VKRVFRPAAAKPEQFFLKLGVAALGVSALFGYGIFFGFWSPGAFLAWLGLAAVAVFADWMRNRRTAFIVTNQRCFQLHHRRREVEVRDVEESSQAAGLDRPDRLELDDHLLALARSGQMAVGGRPAEERRLERELPRELRARLDRELHPGETVLWADRPTARDYLMHAPMDPLSATLGLAGGAFGPVAALWAATIGGNPGAALGWGGVAVASLLLAVLRLWTQIERTVYAVTTERGVVIFPDGTVKTYTRAQLRGFRRTQDGAGRGDLRSTAGQIGDGFYGIRDVKDVDDLIKGRELRDRSTELAPAESPPGRGDEPAPVE
jgi:hypothetical protein